MLEPIVRLRNVTVHRGDRPVLRDVNLDVAAGEFVYLVGRTGSGKSSLLKTLYADLPLREGSGVVAGHDLRKIKRRNLPALRQRLGIVFQEVNLLTDRSVAENLDFVLRATGWRRREERGRRINEVLHAVNLPAARDVMPYALSGGEQQRIAFARALLNKPALVIADEVTGNLDHETSLETLQLMRELARKNNAAILFATHDRRLLEHYQARTLRCKDGVITSLENPLP
ncbi:cell division ATP-binding protein FtsE [Neolewinella antarctica]|uniref:Cell division transport system ATP-binding protein n=1 Tax=Neolewinella antarctica TaxID=442734 RepID=A0ABX0XC45_9BACT|nr:ATP-binding cassette domain-containing protein [Neolewinella antarctica]NJC26524.1 cell division transport system ATP-binding protein [Neolewinella antarctica]